MPVFYSAKGEAILDAGTIRRLADLVAARGSNIWFELDDAAFARLWVESRDRAHPRGEHALIIELRQKGIDATIITATLKARREAAVRWEDAPASDGEEAAARRALPDEVAARKLLARHARSLARIADARQRRQRAYALLARNGFGPEVSGAVAAEVVELDAEPEVERTELD